VHGGERAEQHEALDAMFTLGALGDSAGEGQQDERRADPDDVVQELHVEDVGEVHGVVSAFSPLAPARLAWCSARRTRPRRNQT